MTTNAFTNLARSDQHVARFVHWAHTTIDIVLTIALDDDINLGRVTYERLDEIHASVWKSIVKYAESQRNLRPVFANNPDGTAFLDSRDLATITEATLKWATQFPASVKAAKSVSDLFPTGANG